MGELTIRTAALEGGQARVTLEGTLDGRTAAALEREIEALATRGVRRFVFDLGELDVLTSAGAGVFLGVVVEAEERGGGLLLVHPTPQVQHVIEVLGLRTLLPVAAEPGGRGQRPVAETA
ncbi:MAG: STAS domain-containing protein [Planctomycetia bacterium]|nr:STAS domain-containing protein [Planctomycetia bacterium]